MVDKFKRTRDSSERSLAKKLARALAATKRKILGLVEGAVANPIDELFWEAEATVLGIILNDELIVAGYDAIDAELADIAFVGIDIATASAEVNEFISSYTFDLVKGINATTRKNIQGALDAYFTGEGTTIGELANALTGQFGASRAEGIAVTEVTRAYSAGQSAVLKGLEEVGFEMAEVWNTNHDEVTCKICKPLNDKVRDDGWTEPPPAHPRCRCWTTLEIRDRKKALEIIKESLKGSPGKVGKAGKAGETKIVLQEADTIESIELEHQFLGDEHIFPTNLKPSEVLIVDKNQIGFRKLNLKDLPEIESQITQVFQQGGAPNDFWELKDTPDDYVAASGMFVLVNPTEDGLEFSHKVDFIDFNTSYTNEHQEGRLHWDEGDKTLELGMPGGVVKLQIGQEVHIRAKNTSGGNITNGQAVYVSGGEGANPTVALADARERGKAAIALATEDVDDGHFGYFTFIGLVRDIDTSGFSTAGDLVWVGDTPGDVQAYPAGGTSRNNVIGMVIRKHAEEGIIWVTSFIFNYIDELSGVTVANLQNDDNLVYDADNGLWKNERTAYAEIFCHDNETPTTVPTGDTYTLIDQWNGTGEHQDCLPDVANSQIVFHRTGVYNFILTVSFKSDKANLNVLGAGFLNDVEQHQVHFRRKIATANDEGSASGHGLVRVTASGHAVDFRVRHDDPGDVDVTFTYANLTVTRLGD